LFTGYIVVELTTALDVPIPLFGYEGETKEGRDLVFIEEKSINYINEEFSSRALNGYGFYKDN